MSTIYDLFLESDDKENFISNMTDSEEKAEQLIDALNEECQRYRKAEYDKLNQYEMMFDDQLNGTTTWIDAINSIKAKFPKVS